MTKVVGAAIGGILLTVEPGVQVPLAGIDIDGLARTGLPRQLYGPYFAAANFRAGQPLKYRSPRRSR